MHRHLVRSVRSRGLAAGALLALVWLLPATSPAQTLPAEVREAAADRLWIRDYLRLYDLLLTIQAASGEVSGAEADEQLAVAGWELYEQGFHEEDLEAVREALRETASDFFASIEYEITSSSTWPADLPAESYRSLSSHLLRYARSEFDRALTRGADPSVALRAATLLLAFARGYDALPVDIDYFAGTRERATAALPPIELIEIEGGVPPAAPPPTVSRPPSTAVTPPRVNPTAPVSGGGTGGGAGVPVRVVLRGGTVEAQARLLGESSIDVVGGTNRLDSDGKPDTEIELRILASGFAIENLEIRHEPPGQAGATWSARRAERRPLLGVMTNRVLINQGDGRLGGIRLNDQSVISLYIQDDGRLARSANPGKVVVFFQGGEQATFPITTGAGAPAGGGRVTPVPITGGGGAPPVILTSLPPRTPTAPGGRPAQPPAVTTIPRGLPPPQPGGISRPPVSQPPVSQQPVSRPPTGAPPIRPPISPPPANMPAGGRPPAAAPPVVTPPMTPPTATPAGGVSSRLAALQARWIGLDGDVVSKGAEARPDGSPDGHIRLTVSFSSWQDVTHLALYSSDANGNPAGGQVWHTRDTGYWLLGVLGNGMNLNVRHAPTLGKFNGTVTLDLYAGDSGYFTSGQTFLVEIGMGATEAATQIVQVVGGAPPVTTPVTPPVVTPPVTPPVVTPPAGGGVTPGATTVDWGTLPQNHRGQNGQRFSYACPPNGSAGRGPWGTGIYTDDSSVCTAAVHAGLITFASGGTVTIEIRPGQSSYTGSPGYGGVTSADWGEFQGSFVFVGAPALPPPTATFAGAIATDRASYAQGETITVTFTNFPATNDWIAIAPVAAAAETYVDWKWTDGSTTSGQPASTPLRNGTLTFTAPAPGEYEARVFTDYPGGGYTIRASRAFTVTSAPALPPQPEPAVPEPPAATNAAAHAQRSSYAEGEPIVVEFGGFPGSAQDWIEISPAGTADESYGQWFYLNGQTAGSLQFSGLTPGTYEVRGRFDWPAGGYAVRTRSTFNVVAAEPPPPPAVAGGEAGACDVSGLWHGNIQGIGADDWTFTATGSDAYAAQESGLGNAQGSATVSGYRLQIDWRTGDWTGTILLDLDASCTSASGQNIIHTGGPGTYPMTLQRAGAAPPVGGGVPPAAEEPAAPPAAQYRVTGLSVAWIGIDADVVSVGSATTPDGSPDGRFAVEVAIEGSVELRSVTLHSSDAQGNLEGGQAWTTASGTSWWVLGVGAGGRLLHSGQVATLGVLQAGTTSLDLFAGNSGWFNPGQSFLVELEFADGQKAAQVVQVTGAAAPPAEPPVAPPPAAGGANPINWGIGPMAHRGQSGQRFTFVCSPNGTPTTIWGTGVYTDDSSVCTAAVHAGVITFASGGTVTIEIRPGQSSYTGSPGHGGVTSANWGAYEGSFIVVGASDAAPPATQYRVTGLSGAWFGMDADVVPSSTGAAAPDGAADGHFAVEITIDGSVELRSINVFSSDAQGAGVGGQMWTTLDDGYHWALGVIAGGQLLNPYPVGTFGMLQPGTTRLDLYAGNSGWFNPGQTFVIELVFADEQKAAQIVQIP